MRKPKWTISTIITFIVLVIFAIMCIYPIFWLIINSVKTNQELFENPWGFPTQFAWDNYSLSLIHIYRGFFAWDCGEFIGHCRVACACGLISEPEFWDLVAPWVMRASLMFDNWVDYAVSCACGGVYFMYRESGGSEKGLEDFLRLNLGAAMQLLQNPQIWGDDRWFSPPVKAFKIPPKEIKPVLKNWSGPPACLATDRILVDGCKVGYMYREKPQDENTPDSGWRFFAGDETEEYVNDPAHVAFYHLNTICNYDPDILPLLNSPYGSAFGRDKDGILVGKNRK